MNFDLDNPDGETSAWLLNDPRTYEDTLLIIARDTGDTFTFRRIVEHPNSGNLEPLLGELLRFMRCEYGQRWEEPYCRQADIRAIMDHITRSRNITPQGLLLMDDPALRTDNRIGIMKSRVLMGEQIRYIAERTIAFWSKYQDDFRGWTTITDQHSTQTKGHAPHNLCECCFYYQEAVMRNMHNSIDHHDSMHYYSHLEDHEVFRLIAEHSYTPKDVRERVTAILKDYYQEEAPATR